MLDLIIIGAGPAGLSACLYASRAGLDVLIFDSAAPGGKLNVTAQIENYPGHTPVRTPRRSTASAGPPPSGRRPGRSRSTPKCRSAGSSRQSAGRGRHRAGEKTGTGPVPKSRWNRPQKAPTAGTGPRSAGTRPNSPPRQTAARGGRCAAKPPAAPGQRRPGGAGLHPESGQWPAVFPPLWAWKFFDYPSAPNSFRSRPIRR